MEAQLDDPKYTYSKFGLERSSILPSSNKAYHPIRASIVTRTTSNNIPFANIQDYLNAKYSKQFLAYFKQFQDENALEKRFTRNSALLRSLPKLTFDLTRSDLTEPLIKLLQEIKLSVSI